MKKIILTDQAPAPIGPYSQAILFGNTLYVSGQIAIDPQSGSLNMATLDQETEQVMQNLKAILNAAGTDFSGVLKSTIFLSDMRFFKDVNAIYGRYFSENPPARETVQVAGLPLGVNVEISVIAVIV
jgi:2-iminobutanoate/2-iminopropanoate deaminase